MTCLPVLLIETSTQKAWPKNKGQKFQGAFEDAKADDWRVERKIEKYRAKGQKTATEMANEVKLPMSKIVSGVEIKLCRKTWLDHQTREALWDEEPWSDNGKPWLEGQFIT